MACVDILQTNVVTNPFRAVSIAYSDSHVPPAFPTTVYFHDRRLRAVLAHDQEGSLFVRTRLLTSPCREDVALSTNITNHNVAHEELTACLA